jgi:hypothetical protein
VDENVYLNRLGIRCKITPGALDESAELLFMNGQCHALAMAVARRQGWQVGLIAVRDIDDDELVGTPHVVVCLPDGRYGDIADVYDEETLVNEWGEDTEYAVIEHVHPDDLMRHLGWLREAWAIPETAAAESMVEPLVREWGYELRPALDPVERMPGPSDEAEGRGGLSL